MSEIRTPMFEVADLIPRLTSEFGYTPAGARSVSGHLADADGAIQAAFWRWWQTGEVDSTLEIEGYTAERLVAEKGIKPPGAFATLDWLLRDPKHALTTLRRGHDRILPRRE